ncbi:zinc-binding dehydrogenase [Enemella sp. A6]|uniref:zinc-binding dehydrogenase n=1 Tax=Enemella sp. A6 TaxID=3440152 RepID=UPI003EBCC87D
MWAYRLVRPRTFERVEVPAPSAADVPDRHVLLRVLAGGICGSDFPFFAGRNVMHADDDGSGIAPNVPGHPLHEVVGVVEYSNHPDHAVGDRLVGWATRLDALAQYCISHGDELADCPTDLAPETAVMIQPLACALQPMRAAEVAGKSVTVIGLGPIGLLFAHAAKTLSAAKVTGVDPVDRSDVADIFGLDEVIQAHSGRWAARLGPDELSEVVVDAVGHNPGTANDALLATAFGGRVVLFGVPDDDYYPLPMKTWLRRNLTVWSGTTRNRSRALQDAAEYLAEHPELVEHYVTHSFDVHDVQPAFDTASIPRTGQLKVTLRVPSG